MVMRFKGARREECVQMPGKTARSAARQPLRLPTVTAAARATRLSCQNAGKAQKFMPVRESSGEYRVRWLLCLSGDALPLFAENA
jgi:hypothetical protein